MEFYIEAGTFTNSSSVASEFHTQPQNTIAFMMLILPSICNSCNHRNGFINTNPINRAVLICCVLKPAK